VPLSISWSNLPLLVQERQMGGTSGGFTSKDS
jgi:hypothetical protein